MQDPSYGVPASLLPHVHLISDFRIPIHYQLTSEQIVEYLSNAPRIVKEVQPMTWQYLSHPPQDGAVLLVWQPERQRGLQFASDGYLYADPEQRFQQDIGGMTVEIYAQRQGWRYRAENQTAHTRMRYRLIDKNPAIPGPPVDRNLWLVHYQSLAPQQRIPVQGIRLNAQQVKEIHERTQLEQSGQLARRPFMLNDSSNWPQVQFTPTQPQRGAGQMPGGQMYPGMPMGMRPGQPGYGGQQPGAQGLVGQPPHPKRMRPSTGQMTSVQGVMQPPMGAMQHDPFLEEEETIAMGDMLDHLTPRDISLVRYTQHHEWMEEILGSPYSIHQITPIDLGLGLSGELADLTRDILDAPDEKSVVGQKHQPAEYKQLVADKRKEVDNRMEAFFKRQQDEIEKMKAEHAQVMATLKKGKTYVKAERQLKDIKGAHLEVESDPAEEIVSLVENTLNVKIGPRQDVLCVSKGGLIEEEPRPSPPAVQETEEAVANGAAPTNGVNGVTNGAQEGGSNSNTDNEAGGMLDQFGNSSSFNTPGNNVSTPAANLTSQGQSAADTPGVMGGLPADQEFSLEGIDENADGDDGMDLLDNMDIDIPDMDNAADIDNTADDTQGGGANVMATDDWVMVDDTDKPADASAPSAEAAQVLDQAATEPAAAAPPIGETAVVGEQPPAEPAGDELFGESADFNDFANLEDSAGDALADFGGDGGDLGDLGLDNSAFDDLDAGDAGDAGPSQGPAAEAAAAEAAAEPAIEVGKAEAPVTVGAEGQDAASLEAPITTAADAAGADGAA